MWGGQPASQESLQEAEQEELSKGSFAVNNP